jgi:hypothetical protein
MTTGDISFYIIQLKINDMDEPKLATKTRKRKKKPVEMIAVTATAIEWEKFLAILKRLDLPAQVEEGTLNDDFRSLVKDIEQQVKAKKAKRKKKVSKQKSIQIQPDWEIFDPKPISCFCDHCLDGKCHQCYEEKSDVKATLTIDPFNGKTRTYILCPECKASMNNCVNVEMIEENDVVYKTGIGTYRVVPKTSD